MATLWRELRRRNVVRVGVAYLAGVWVLIQVADVVLPNFGAPDWVIQALIFSCTLGFPLALALAWFYELTADGVKSAADVEVVEPARFTGRKLDFVIIGLLVFAVGFLLFSRPAGDAVDEQLVAPLTAIAVLPFDNLSPDPNNAYFALGMHDEILNTLAKLSALDVKARTSVMRFAENPPPIEEIAAELNVGSILEGSVRFAENRVRVTTQLIETATGNHLWSETYEHEFEDLFAIESDVAMNVANALEAEFTEEEQQAIYSPRTDSPQALALFWQAGSMIVLNQWRRAPPFLDRAIAVDPNFADAYALRAFANSMAITAQAARDQVDLASIEASVTEDVERALSLDPEAGIAYAAIGNVHARRRRGAEAQAAFERMYELLPNLTGILWVYSGWNRSIGRFTEAARLAEEAIALDPTNPVSHRFLARALHYSGEYERAAQSFRTYLESNPSSDVHLEIAMVEASRGNDAEALEHLRLAEELQPSSTAIGALPQYALLYSLIDRPEDAERNRAAIEAQQARGAFVPPPFRAMLALAFDQNDEALAALRQIAAFENRPAGGEIEPRLKYNIWNLPVLEELAFVEVRAQLGQRGF